MRSLLFVPGIRKEAGKGFGAGADVVIIDLRIPSHRTTSLWRATSRQASSSGKGTKPHPRSMCGSTISRPD
jgi:hypothetical protein